MTRSSAVRELNLIGDLLVEPLLRHDYATVEHFLVQWGKVHNDICELTAIGENEFTLASYKRIELTSHPFKIKHSIRYKDEKLIELEMVKDFTIVLAGLKSFTFQFIGGIFFLIIILGLAIWFSLKRTAITPLEMEIEDRERMENQLMEKTIYLDNILHSSTDLAIATTDLDFTIKYYNPEAERIFGYRAEDVIGRTVMEMHTKEKVDPARFQHAIDKVRKEGEYRYSVEQDCEGGKKFIESRVSGIWNQEKDLIGFVLTARDVTKRMEAAENLDKSLSILYATLESTADGLLVVDRSGKIVSYNNKFTEMWGIPENIMESRNDKRAMEYVRELLMEPDVFDKRVKQLYNDHEAESFDMLEFKDGRVFERYSKPQKISGITVGRVWSFRDVTGRKMAERALLENQEQLQAIIDNSTALIYLKDREGKYLLINRRYEELFKITSEDISSRTDYDIFPENVAATLRLNDLKVLEEKKSIESEEIIPHEDGEHIYLSIKFPLNDLKGEPYGVCCISTDITERKTMENKLVTINNELAQKTNYLERFQKITVNRELDMIKLKEEVNALLEGSGQEKRYRIVEKTLEKESPEFV